MKKETIIAIILGVGTGIIIAILIIINTQKNSTSTDNSYQSTTITPEITFTPKKTEPLLITSPRDGSSTTSSTVQIKGKAPKGSTIIFQSASEELAIKTKSPEWSVNFPLSLGENMIKVVQYLDKTSDTRQFKIYKISK